MPLVGIQFDGGVQHAVHLHVDAELQFAQHFRADVEPHHRLAENPPRRGIARLGVDHRRNARRVRCEIDIGDPRSVRQHHMAGLGAEIGQRRARALGRRKLQRLAGDGAGHPQLLIGVGDGARPTRHLQPGLSKTFERGGARLLGGGALVRSQEGCELLLEARIEIGGVRSGEPDLELTGIEVHLLGDHHRLHRAGALADIGMLGNQRDLARTDLDPRVEGHGIAREARSQRIVAGRFSRLHGRAVAAECNTAGQRRGTDEEGPTRKTLRDIHVTSPPSSLRPPCESLREYEDRCRSGKDCRT